MQVDISEDTYLLGKCLKPLAESTQKDARGTNGVKLEGKDHKPM